MKKDKIIIISMLGVLMLGLVLLALGPIKEVLGFGTPMAQQKTKNNKKRVQGLREALPEINAVDFSEVDKKSTCFSTDKKTFELGSMIIPGKSLFVETITFPGKKYVGAPDSFVLQQYDLITEKVAFEYDLGKECAEELMAGYELPMFVRFEKIKDNPDPVISTALFSQNEDDDILTLIINPVSGEVNKLTDYPYDLFEVEDFSKQADFFIFSEPDFMAAQGFDEELFIMTDINGVLFASLTGASITSATQELVKHFPALREHAGNPDKHFLIYFAEGYDKEDLMEFFKPTKDKSFAPFKMDKEIAIDNQSHDITSFAEFEEWSRFSFKNMPSYEEDFEDLDILTEELKI